MLRSIGLGNSYFPTRISESEVGVLAEFRVSHLEIRHFRLQWNDISYWETRKFQFPSPMERSNKLFAIDICSGTVFESLRFLTDKAVWNGD